MGCGEGEGVADDAVVTAYVEAPLCTGAEQELRDQDGRAGGLRVQAVCLPDAREDEGGAGGAKRLDLAALGANARQATEDSTTVAYLEPVDPPSTRFVHPILEAAGVAWISRGSGGEAMAQLLQLIEAWDSGSLRESIRVSLREP